MQKGGTQIFRHKDTQRGTSKHKPLALPKKRGFDYPSIIFLYNTFHSQVAIGWKPLPCMIVTRFICCHLFLEFDYHTSCCIFAISSKSFISRGNRAWLARSGSKCPGIASRKFSSAKNIRNVVERKFFNSTEELFIS